MRIGILGGGQLARMMALAGHPLGFEFVFVDPAPDACAKDLGKLQISPWSGAGLVDALAGCDRVTFDFENVPADSLALLNEHFTVFPSPKALAVSQDRLAEKTLCIDAGLKVAPFCAVSTRPDLLAGLDEVGVPALLKTRRLGYDGKGQYLIQSREDYEPAWQALGSDGAELILEGWVDFHYECALTAVRDAEGQVRFYPLSLTQHQQGVLRFAISGAPRLLAIEEKAQSWMRSILEKLNYVGCLTVEFFVTDHGLVINELAPRVHNSAHWTIEGAACSQFENHLRAIAGLPLGSTSARGASLMINCLGQMPDQALLAMDDLHWHDYAKAPRAGRKVGHLNWVSRDFETMAARVDALKSHLASDQFQALTGLIKSAG